MVIRPLSGLYPNTPPKADNLKDVFETPQSVSGLQELY